MNPGSSPPPAGPRDADGYRVDPPRWFIWSGARVFYLACENFAGSILGFRAAVEYNPLQNLGIGLGLDSLRAHGGMKPCLNSAERIYHDTI